MESKLILKSKTSSNFKFTAFFLIPFGVFLLYLCLFLLEELYKDIYPQLIAIFFCLLIGGFGFFGLWSLYDYNIFYIYTDKIITKSIFGYKKGTIPIKNLISWSEVERKSKNSSWHELIFFTDKSKFSINSKDHENYPKLKEKLTKDLPQDTIEVKKSNIWKIIPILMFGLVSLALFNSVYDYSHLRNNFLKESDLTTINDELINEPKIIKESKGHRSIDIKLKSTPKFTFDISEETYHAMHASDFVKDTKIGDSISIKVLKEDYDKKIVKKTPLTFLDTQGYTIIKVYEVKYKNKTYLNLSNYNLALEDNEPLYWFSGLLGIFFLFLTIIGIVNFEKIGNEEEISE
jgi:hypothetical protein